MPPVFVDTSVWYAALDRCDAHHSEAASLLGEPAGDHGFRYGQGHRTQTHRQRPRGSRQRADDRGLVPDVADRSRIPGRQRQLEAAVPVRGDREIFRGEVRPGQGFAGLCVDHRAADCLRRSAGGSRGEKEEEEQRGNGEERMEVAHNEKAAFSRYGKTAFRARFRFPYAGMIQVRFEGYVISGRKTGHPQRMFSMIFKVSGGAGVGNGRYFRVLRRQEK